MAVFDKVNTKVEKFSVYSGDPRKIDVASDSYIIGEALRRDEAKRVQEDAALEAAVAEKEKAVFNRFAAVNEAFVNEGRTINNLASLNTRYKDHFFKKILCELYTKSLVIDDYFVEANQAAINGTVEAYVDSNGGFALLENAIAATNSKLLKKIKSICEESAKKVCERKVKECNAADKNTYDVVFDTTPEEDKEFEYKTNEISPDEIADLVKDKVLTVVKDESDENKKRKEATDEIEGAITDELKEDEDDKDDDKDSDDDKEDKKDSKKSKKSDSESDDEDEDDDDDEDDDKKSKKSDDDDDSDDMSEFEDELPDEDDDKDDKKSKESDNKDDDEDKDDDDDEDDDKKSKKSDDDNDEDDKEDKKDSKKSKKEATEDDVKEAFNRIVVQRSPIEESTLFHALIHNAYHEALTENATASGGFMASDDDEFNETYDINADEDDAVRGSMDPNTTDTDLSGKFYGAEPMRPDKAIRSNAELNMDLIMTEAIAQYTLMEMLYTLKLENYTSTNIRKLSDKMINSKMSLVSEGAGELTKEQLNKLRDAEAICKEFKKLSRDDRLEYLQNNEKRMRLKVAVSTILMLAGTIAGYALVIVAPVAGLAIEILSIISYMVYITIESGKQRDLGEKLLRILEDEMSDVEAALAKPKISPKIKSMLTSKKSKLEADIKRYKRSFGLQDNQVNVYT